MNKATLRETFMIWHSERDIKVTKKLPELEFGEMINGEFVKFKPLKQVKLYALNYGSATTFERLKEEEKYCPEVRGMDEIEYAIHCAEWCSEFNGLEKPKRVFKIKTLEEAKRHKNQMFFIGTVLYGFN